MIGEAPDINGLRPEAYLGGGGFADVYLYVRENLNLRVAVKVLRGTNLSPELREQFKTEALALGHVTESGTHPHIVAVHDFGEVSQRPFLVMEYYPSGSLADLVAAGPLPPARVVRIGVQLAGALQTAHNFGIVHRDVKPSNVLLTADGEPKLSDFGIAAITASSISAGVEWFSAHYAAPEVARSVADARADVYALAATLYELLAGHPPFWVDGGDNGARAAQERARTWDVPPIGRDDLPPNLERLLELAMTKDPAEREGYVASAEAFAEALRGIAADAGYEPTRVSVYQPATGPAAGPATGRSGTGRRPEDETTGDLTGAAVGPRAQVAPSRPDWSSLDIAETGRRPDNRVTTAVKAPPATPRWRSWLPLGVAVLVAVVLGSGVYAAIRAGTGTTPPAGADTEAAVDGADQGAVPGARTPVPAPSVVAERLPDGAVRFRWTYEPVLTGDFFQVRRTDTAEAVPPVNVRTPEYVVSKVDGARPCVEVVLVRANGRGSVPAKACAPAAGESGTD